MERQLVIYSVEWKNEAGWPEVYTTVQKGRALGRYRRVVKVDQKARLLADEVGAERSKILAGPPWEEQLA